MCKFYLIVVSGLNGEVFCIDVVCCEVMENVFVLIVLSGFYGVEGFVGLVV